MPLYEYRCQKCGYVFEKIIKINDPNPPCPSLAESQDPCGHHTEKLISRTNFSLKGGGWYSDGYGK